jgi:hypothetical protein
LTPENRGLLANWEMTVAQKNLPTMVREALAVPAAERSDDHWLTLAGHALPIVCDEELKRLPAPIGFHIVAGSLPHEAKTSAPRQVNILQRGQMNITPATMFLTQ